MTKIEVENLLQPGKTYKVDAGKYAAARKALLALMPCVAPGETPAALQKAMLAQLPGDLFPGGEKAGWWMKCVQLDLEAKGIIARSSKPPVRLYRV